MKWSRKEYINLPWRKNRSLYTTLVSEIMLQQTTVSTVKKHFDRFLKAFPNIFTLAAATEEEVCSQWQGLGYYRRARNLHKAAVSIVNDYEGKFPETSDELKKIPGIGEYTASALIAIGRNKVDLALDANLERVFSRLYLIKVEKGLKLQREIKKRLHQGALGIDFKKYKARELNEALMDLGRVYCQARRADCKLCPLKEMCKAYHSSIDPLTLPLDSKAKNKPKFHELELLRIVVRKGKQILAYYKADNEWLSGQIEIPTFILSSEDKALAQYPYWPGKKPTKGLPQIKTAITKYKIKNLIWVMDYKEFQSFMNSKELEKRYKYFKLNIQSHHFSTTSLKVFKKLNLEENL